MSGKLRVGVDIGGTFTDATLIDETNGNLRIAKVSTTPKDPALGFLSAVSRIIDEAGVNASEIRHVVHGTTVATNAILEGQIAVSAFVTTEGFRDILEIARQSRPSLYDVQFDKVPPLIPRFRCFAVRERMDARGNVLEPLDEQSVIAAADEISRLEVESVAICLLHSYANPAHEKRVAEILKARLPNISLSVSHEVIPEFREYVRASTTVVNACIQPVVASYMRSIGEKLQSAGIAGELLVMQSNGGVFTARAASERPVYMIESGPAAGVIAAAHLGTVLNCPDLISFDMGGTSAKVALVRNGTPGTTKNYMLGATAQPGIAETGSRGYPIRTPVVDLVEIGAGGGSIAWVDSGGMLRVGPRSAGADPGPVCYARGGIEPTVTDANLVLGRLDPDYFLGGQIKLDAERAHEAIERRCARPLRLTVTEAARGIVEIANFAMVNALHLVSVQRGYDPREFALLAFGGAGPVHCNALAAEAAIEKVIVPMGPGVFSSLGLLVTDLKRDYTASVLKHLDAIDLSEIDSTFRSLEAQGARAMHSEGLEGNDLEFVRQADMRYVGQSYELTLPVDLDSDPTTASKALANRFHTEHERAYGHKAPGEPIEVVSLRLTAVGRIAKPQLKRLDHNGTAPTKPRSTREVYFTEAAGYVPSSIYNRYDLLSQARISGPAIVEEADSTTVIHPGWIAVVDLFGNLILTPETKDKAKAPGTRGSS